MGTLLQDLKYGLRMLIKNPGFTAVAVLTLALGIGANTAIFSVVNAVFLRHLPYKDPHQLVMVWEQNPSKGWYRNIVSAANFVDWRKQNRVFTDMAAISESGFNLTGTNEPEEILGERVTVNLFSLLGVQAAVGRTFLPEEDQPDGPRVVVLSNGLWKRRYGGDRSILGRHIEINNASFRVIGIMPSTFYFSPFGPKAELWLAGLNLRSPHRTDHAYLALARLKPGVSLAQAQSDLDSIARSIERQYPENTGMGVGLVDLREQVVGQTRSVLALLFAAVGLVLLIACANVANLMLSRATAREKEIAIRTALGAGRGRLIRQFLAESGLLAITGGVLGLLLAGWGIDALIALAPPDTPGLEYVRLDARVLGFTLLISLATGILFGFAPALSASKSHVNETLKEGGRSSTGGPSRNRLRSFLVASEFALALVLLTAAGLMIRSLVFLRQVDLGFTPKGLLTMRIALLGSKYKDQAQQSLFFQKLLPQIQSLPGVQSVALSRGIPIYGWAGMDFVTDDHPYPSPAEQPDANYLVISPDYFRTVRIPLLKGRVFTEQDTHESAGVAIVNEALARKYWPGQDPIGKRFKMGRAESKTPWLTVVGVVGNVRTEGQWAEFRPELYVPYTQYPWVLSPRHVLVRAAVNPTGLTAAIQREVGILDKDQPISQIRTMEEVVALPLAQQRFSMVLLGIFAGLALTLAAVGIFGVISYAVAQRTHEIGIRMALGAQRNDVLRLVVGQGLVLVLIGVTVGLAAGFGLTRLMSTLLFGVRPTDPATFAVVSIALTGVALLASYVPARRASKVDPMVALRYE